MEKLNTCVCNQCGKIIVNEKNGRKEDFFLGEKNWGYFSGKDGERHRFYLCEKCYDQMTAGFVKPVEVEEILELL